MKKTKLDHKNAKLFEVTRRNRVTPEWNHHEKHGGRKNCHEQSFDGKVQRLGNRIGKIFDKPRHRG